jgi:hypothetical protein
MRIRVLLGRGLRCAHTASELVKPEIGIAVRSRRGLRATWGEAGRDRRRITGGGPGVLVYNNSELRNHRFEEFRKADCRGTSRNRAVALKELEVLGSVNTSIGRQSIRSWPGRAKLSRAWVGLPRTGPFSCVAETCAWIGAAFVGRACELVSFFVRIAALTPHGQGLIPRALRDASVGTVVSNSLISIRCPVHINKSGL